MIMRHLIVLGVVFLAVFFGIIFYEDSDNV